MALWRREFLGLTLAALGGGAANAATNAEPPSAAPPSATPTGGPTADPQDAWLDEGGQRHRIIFDTVSAHGAGDALTFADNFYKANRDGYGIAGKDLSVVIVLRHFSGAFGFNDAAWAKYGPALAEWGGLAETEREKSRAAMAEYVLTAGVMKPHPTVNPYDTEPPDPRLYSNGRRLSGVAQQGARYAVCEVAAGTIAALASKATGADRNTVLADLKTMLIANAVMVPAGIVTFSRAQERGYTASSCG